MAYEPAIFPWYAPTLAFVPQTNGNWLDPQRRPLPKCLPPPRTLPGTRNRLNDRLILALQAVF
jgi:hypothetical protein